MAFTDLITDLFDGVEKRFKDLEKRSTSVKGSVEELTSALEDEEAVTDRVAGSKKKLIAAGRELAIVLAAVVEHQYEYVKKMDQQSKLLIRGSNLLSSDADIQKRNIMSLKTVGMEYRKMTGASLEDSMTMVRNYQSAYKVANGEFDGESVKFLGSLGQVTRILGSTVEEMYAIQEKLLVKGKFGKDFSDSVSAMMVDAGEKYNINARESLEALDDTLNHSLHLDQEARKKNIKLSLEGAALSKQAAVDFGKYATSLTGAKGTDALKAVAYLSSMTGESMESVDEKRRSFAETGGKDTRLLDVQVKAAEALLGTSDLLKSYDATRKDPNGLSQRSVMEETLKVQGGFGGETDLNKLVEYMRVKGGIRDQDPKLNDQFDPKKIASMANELQTPDETKEMAKAIVESKVNEATQGWADGLIRGIESLTGFLEALGLSTNALKVLGVAMLAFGGKNLIQGGASLVRGGAGMVRGMLGGAGAAGAGGAGAGAAGAAGAGGAGAAGGAAAGGGAASAAGIGLAAGTAVIGGAAVGAYLLARRQEGITSKDVDNAAAASRRSGDAATQLREIRTDIRRKAYSDEEWKLLPQKVRSSFMKDLRAGKITDETVFDRPTVSTGDSSALISAVDQKDEQIGSISAANETVTDLQKVDETKVARKMDIVSKPTEKIQVKTAEPPKVDAEIADKGTKESNELAARQLAVQQDMLNALRDDGAFTTFKPSF